MNTFDFSSEAKYPVDNLSASLLELANAAKRAVKSIYNEQNSADKMKMLAERLKSSNVSVTRGQLEALIVACNAIFKYSIKQDDSQTDNFVDQSHLVGSSETAISDAIDKTLPIIDELELSESQRSLVDKSTHKINLSKLHEIPGIISMVIGIILHFIPSQQVKEVIENQQTQIRIDQEQVQYLKKIYDEILLSKQDETQYPSYELDQSTENVDVSASDLKETVD